LKEEAELAKTNLKLSIKVLKEVEYRSMMEMHHDQEAQQSGQGKFKDFIVYI